jgi:hypothetical protein
VNKSGDLFLFLLLWLPGIDADDGGSVGKPFFTDAVARVLRDAPLSFHRSMAEAAGDLQLYHRQVEMAPVEVEEYNPLTNERAHYVQGDCAHVGFLCEMRARYHGGATCTRSRPKPKLQ